MTLADQIKALPSIKDEHGDECVSREAVLGVVGDEQLLRTKFTDLAVELEKHSNDHIHDEIPDNLAAAVEGVCADRINAILKDISPKEKAHGPVSERFMRHHYGASGFVAKKPQP